MHDFITNFFVYKVHLIILGIILGIIVGSIIYSNAK